MAEGDLVLLICGSCGRTRKMWTHDWERWKKKRRESGTVVLCEKPSTIRGSKAKCLGVLDEAPEGTPEKS